MQLRELVEYAARRGWQIASEYVDRMSGKYVEGQERMLVILGNCYACAVAYWVRELVSCDFGKSILPLNAGTEPTLGPPVGRRASSADRIVRRNQIVRLGV